MSAQHRWPGRQAPPGYQPWAGGSRQQPVHSQWQQARPATPAPWSVPPRAGGLPPQLPPQLPPRRQRGLTLVLGSVATAVLVGVGALLAGLGLFAGLGGAATVAGDFGKALVVGDCDAMERLATDELFHERRECEDVSGSFSLFGVGLPSEVQVGEVDVAREPGGDEANATVEVVGDDAIDLELNLVKVTQRGWLVDDFDYAYGGSSLD